MIVLRAPQPKMNDASMQNLTESSLLERLGNIVGPAGIIEEADAAPMLLDWRKRLAGKARLVLAPDRVEQISEIMRQCHAAGQKIALQGGNTGLVGGSVPDASGEMILLSTRRLNKIRSLDALNLCITLESGCILDTAQKAAALQNCMLPISLGSSGSATIGGLISTNAGGHMTLRYGNMREQVLGLEIVLADGTLLNLLQSLRKNNTGYDLKQLFIGAEGTLGLITAASLHLLPQSASSLSAWIGCESPQQALALHFTLQQNMGEHLTALELMAPACVQAADEYLFASQKLGNKDWAVLLRCESGGSQDALRCQLETALQKATDLREITQALVAQNEKQEKEFWRYREALVLAEPTLGIIYKHDIAVPVSAVPQFIMLASAALEKHFPDIVIYPFGHLADGNLHFNCGLPKRDTQRQAECREEISKLVHDVALACGGTLSAEHGIGRFKAKELERTQDKPARDLMLKIKSILDCKNILSPGVIFGQD